MSDQSSKAPTGKNNNNTFGIDKSTLEFLEKVLDQADTFLLGAIGLFVALSWNDSVQTAFAGIKTTGNRTAAKFAFAVVITVAFVLLVYGIEAWSIKRNELIQQKKEELAAESRTQQTNLYRRQQIEDIKIHLYDDPAVAPNADAGSNMAPAKPAAPKKPGTEPWIKVPDFYRSRK